MHWLKRLISDALGCEPGKAVQSPQEVSTSLHDGGLIFGNLDFDIYAPIFDPPKNPNARIIVLHRHPLDCFVARIWRHMYVKKAMANPDSSAHIDDVTRGMLLGYYDKQLNESYPERFRKAQQQRIIAWIESGWCHQVRYEDLVFDPTATFESCLKFLEIDTTKISATEIIEQNRQRIMQSGRVAEGVDAFDSYRVGLPGEWRYVFRDDDLPILRQKYGDLFARQGYTI